MQVAGLAYSAWIISGYLATSKGLSEGEVELAVIICSFAQGIGAAIIWTALGKFLDDCVKSSPERAGLGTSMFWTIACGSSVFSYMFNSVILGHFEP
jgi:hypothetical protein